MQARARARLRVLEDAVPVAALVLMMLLPLSEAALRSLFNVGIPGAVPFVQHLTLWVGFLGAALAAREGKLLSLATGEFLPKGKAADAARVFSAAVSAGAAALLARAGVDLVVIERESETTIAVGVAVWVAQLAIPIAFSLIAARLVWRASEAWQGRA